ncbi:MAG: MBL fold metallo-hydrolase [Verrucomicrobia bacterium]|nr:MBL fold metallo-hydrolase [Verrucomicrobiota bacterium]
MNLVIHRGSNQIGGSCVEVESQGNRLLIDLGLPLDAEGDPRQFLPAVSGLDGKDSSLLGILISHPHQDHFGLLAQISPDVKIGMGAAARRILTAAAPFIRDRLPPPVSGWSFEHEKSLQIGPFTVTPYLVDHSAYDSYALLIEADGKRVFYSGDFRAHGRKSRLFESIIKNPPKEIDVLLLEGSSIGRLNNGETFPTEQEMETDLVKAFAATKGLALVHASAQNIDRLVSIFRACKQTGRTMVIDLYAAAVLEATGNLKLPQSSWDGVALFLPKSQRVKVKKAGWFDLLEQHSSRRIYMRQIQKEPGKYVLLFRPLHLSELESSACLVDASYIYSQWEGYWGKDDFDEVKSLLARHQIAEHHIHTSGHASPADLQKFAEALKPDKVVPIHSFMPGKYADLFPNVEIHVDGERWKVC